MILVHGILRLELPEVHSLKGRRRIVHSLKERLKAFNIWVLDFSGEYVREAGLALAWLAHDSRQAAQIRQSSNGRWSGTFRSFSGRWRLRNFEC